MTWPPVIPDPNEPDWGSFVHDHQYTCDRQDNDGYDPVVGDVVRRHDDSASWWVSETLHDGCVRLMPFKNGKPGWWWRTTPLTAHASHLNLITAAKQEGLF